MGPLDVVWHLANFFVPALGVALIAATGAKLFWRRELAAVRWHTLARDAFLAGAVVLLAGLAIRGRDGSMATYAALVVASAAVLWWRGFRPRRR